MFILLLFFAIAGIGIIIRCASTVNKQKRADLNCPIQSRPAKIIAKTVSVGTGTFIQVYSVVFECESGERLEFSVAADIGKTLMEQDRGTLTYQGKRLIEFKRSM